jgi:hypothetical protein
MYGSTHNRSVMRDGVLATASKYCRLRCGRRGDLRDAPPRPRAEPARPRRHYRLIRTAGAEGHHRLPKLSHSKGSPQKVGNNLGTKSPEYPVKPSTKTEEKAKRANKMHNRRLICNQGVRGSSPLRSTTLSWWHTLNEPHGTLRVGESGKFGSQALAGCIPQLVQHSPEGERTTSFLRRTITQRRPQGR